MIKKDYRPIINSLLDLCDTTDLEDLECTLKSAVEVVGLAIRNRNVARDTERFMRAIDPWFDPKHPMNATERKS